ncbi:MAG TPA: DUF6580 family putative transport protein [Bacteroidales bacterium]|nr:DUF6580 family putative transport protein [Bacteroidales bacterium]
MKYKTLTPRFIVVFSVIVVAALLRLLPHWPNFTPIAAMALFAGTYFEKKQYAFAIPITAMFLSDLFIGFHSNMPAVYISFAITVLIGMTLRRRVNIGTVFVAALSSSVIFFLITNFSAWLASPFYPQNFTGLMESYLAGLVFFRDQTHGFSFLVNDLLGTLFFSAVFYGAFYLAEMRFPMLDKSRF